MEIDDMMNRLDIQPWIPQIGQVVRRIDSKEPLGTITKFKMGGLGLMATIDRFSGEGEPTTTQAVGLLVPINIREVIVNSSYAIHRAMERIIENG